MDLWLLGTGTCAPNPQRTPACYYLSMGARRILIDPGPGAVNRVVQAGLDPFDTTSIFITHHHPDHFADLIPYLFSYKYCLGGRPAEDVRIVAPEGFGKIFDDLMIVHERWVISGDYKIVIDEVLNARWDEPGARFTSAKMAHGVNSVGYRFEEEGGGVLAYSGDTAFCEELIELARGADALLVECSVPDGTDVDGHMRPSEVGRVGVESGVPRLILTHFYPETDPAQAVDSIRAVGYGGEVIAGADGMKLRI